MKQGRKEGKGVKSKNQTQRDMLTMESGIQRWASEIGSETAVWSFEVVRALKRK